MRGVLLIRFLRILRDSYLHLGTALIYIHKLVGRLTFFGFSDENDKCEIGYELLTTFQGQGEMKESSESY